MVLHIVTDTAGDVPLDWRSRYGVSIVPINLNIGGKTLRDEIDVDTDLFFKLIEERQEIPKTAAPAPAQFMETYRRIAKAGETILSIHIGEKLSATYEACKTAAEELKNEFRIIPFNSQAGSAAVAYMCREAREMQSLGKPLEDIIRRLEYIRDNLTIILTLDTLDFARLSGRIKALPAAIISLLKIKPIIELKDGTLVMTDKVRTRSRSIDYVLEKVKQRVQDRLVNAAVMHVRAKEAAEQLAKRVRETLNCNELLLSQISNGISAHLGPGAVGIVAYPVKEG